ncbi:hypothetical protein M011DRAFT_402736 [Sporormia fimetaria CBS 119925]|uniref:Uncharacterized protein n=1 Tax=Sporormia fimetaria CBS 119925 TaxID=1340428 RepID=A0A6A6V9T8_9PLEO|nr:hypothetical protein M011DRAFT_402736 [Sporormia fimetaria CBS 119925]
MSSTDAQPSEPWDEAQCKAALAQLETLQQQLDNLRLTVHRMTKPLSKPPTDKPLLFSQYKQAAVGSQNSLRAFRAQWLGEDVQSLFRYSRESAQANPDLNASSQLPRYGWKRRADASHGSAGAKQSGENGSLSSDAITNNDDMGRAIEAIRQEDPHVKVQTADDNRDITISFMAETTFLKFHITLKRDANGQDKLKAECLRPTTLSDDITRSIETRERPHDFRYLLDMILAYKTIEGKTCAKCGKAADQRGHLPTARRAKGITTDEEKTLAWKAFHRGCLD